MKNRLVQLTVQTTVQVPFLKITAILWHGEVLRAYFPFHHTEYEKDMCLRVFTASSIAFLNETGMWQ